MIEVKQFKILSIFPLVIIAGQVLPTEYSLAIGTIFAVAGLVKKFRALLLFGFAMLGHLFWIFTSGYFAANIYDRSLLIIVGRFGLIGYIILFVLWRYFQPCDSRYLRLGNLKESLKFPLIWWGFKEYIWRFILIFCISCFAATVFFSIHNNAFSIMLYGFIFALINSLLEGLLWRGLILERVVDFLGEKQALVITSLAFGFYHLSLGFSIWICLVFAIGGFYMGGCAIKSKGLFAPIMMHLFVNMIFVSVGIIF